MDDESPPPKKEEDKENPEREQHRRNTIAKGEEVVGTDKGEPGPEKGNEIELVVMDSGEKKREDKKEEEKEKEKKKEGTVITNNSSISSWGLNFVHVFRFFWNVLSSFLSCNNFHERYISIKFLKNHITSRLSFT